MSKVPLTPGHKGICYHATQDLEAQTSKTLEEQNNNEKVFNRTKCLHSGAILSSWVSGIVSVLTGIAAIVLSQLLHSESLFGYGLDSVLDSLSSVVVLWRFYDQSCSSKADARERRACVAVAILFIASSCSLLLKSTNTIINQTVISDGDDGLNGKVIIIAFSSCCGVAALVIASVKVYIGRQLRSQVLITDSIITYVGACISFLGLLALEVYVNDEDVWFLDAVFGLLCGVFLFSYGLKLLLEMTCLHKKKPLQDLKDIQGQ